MKRVLVCIGIILFVIGMTCSIIPVATMLFGLRLLDGF